MHCSAGRGRTGTLITTFLIAEYLLNVSETCFPAGGAKETGFREQRQEPDNFYSENPENAQTSRHGWTRISLFSMIRRLREQRWCMVSTDQQYAYCYQFLTQWLRNGETARLRADIQKCSGQPGSARP